MTRLNVLTTSLLAAALSLSACGGDDNKSVSQPDTPEVVEQQQTISGTITDADGNPIGGTNVTVGSQTVLTDSSGTYLATLENVASNTVILIKKAGYLTTARELTVLPDQSYNLDISLTADQVTTAFDSRSGLTALPVSGAKVTIPASSVVNLDGSDFTGTVQVAANYYNPDSIEGMRAFAQPFTGQDADGSDQTDLVTVGVIDVKLTDPATGAELDLKDGASATLSFPEASTDQDLASIPLWYYDEDQLIWIKDGVATRQADGSYQGEVSHFTLWNLDFPVGDYPATIEGCIIDAVTKQPFVGDFSAYLYGRGYVNLSSGIASDEGSFSTKIPINTPITLIPGNPKIEFDPVNIPALGLDDTYQINDGRCIEVSSIEINKIVDYNDTWQGYFETLPPQPITVTPNPLPLPPTPPSSILSYDVQHEFNTSRDYDERTAMETLNVSQTIHHVSNGRITNSSDSIVIGNRIVNDSENDAKSYIIADKFFIEFDETFNPDNYASIFLLYTDKTVATYRNNFNGRPLTVTQKVANYDLSGAIVGVSLDMPRTEVLEIDRSLAGYVFPEGSQCKISSGFEPSEPLIWFDESEKTDFTTLSNWEAAKRAEAADIELYTSELGRASSINYGSDNEYLVRLIPYKSYYNSNLVYSITLAAVQYEGAIYDSYFIDPDANDTLPTPYYMNNSCDSYNDIAAQFIRTQLKTLNNP